MTNRPYSFPLITAYMLFPIKDSMYILLSFTFNAYPTHNLSDLDHVVFHEQTLALLQHRI